MNDLNLIENQLRSWNPRQPSARLKAELFCHPATACRCWLLPTVLTVRWFAPALTCLLLTFAALQQPVSLTVKSANNSSGELLASLSLSNQFLASALGGGSNRNLWERVTFEWTRGSRLTSTVDSLARFCTNSLTR